MDTLNAGSFRGQAGRHLSFVCPSVVAIVDSVWGTDVYTDDSRICLAALHAGVLAAGQPGVVTLVLGTGATAFPGSTRNGVTSRNYGQSHDYSFTFDSSGTPGLIDWATTAANVPPDFRAPVTVACPSSPRQSPEVWGTDVYSADSSICAAAVHAGAIMRDGGLVTVTMAGAASAYTASTRNGIDSLVASAGASSFSVGAAAPSSGSAPDPIGLLVRIDDQGRASATWGEVPGASYFASRWKLGDTTCCNATSPPGALLTSPAWQDGPLPGAGTYGYRVFALQGDSLAVMETQVDWAGAVPAVDGATGLPRSGQLLSERPTTTAPSVVTAPTAGVPGPETTMAILSLQSGFGAFVGWTPVPNATAYNIYRVKSRGEPGVLIGTVSADDAARLEPLTGALGALDPELGAQYWVDAVLAGGGRSEPGPIADLSTGNDIFGIISSATAIPNLRATVGGTGLVTYENGSEGRGNRVTWTWDSPAPPQGAPAFVYWATLEYLVDLRSDLLGISFGQVPWVQAVVVRPGNETFAVLAEPGAAGPPYVASFPAGTAIKFCVAQFPIEEAVRAGNHLTAGPMGTPISCLDTQLPP